MSDLIPVPAAAADGQPWGALDGPWTCGFWVELAFPLKSKSNFRRGNAQRGRQWDALRGFESSVGTLVTAARPPDWVVGEPSDAVSARPLVLVSIAARSLVDTANFSKSVLDACEGLLFVSDASVLATSSLGLRQRTGQVAVVAFAQLPAGTPLTETAAALGRLGEHAAALLQR